MPIANEEARGFIPGKGLRELLCRPCGRGARGDSDVNQFAPIMAQDNEYLEDLECQSRDHQKIERGGAVQMIAKERFPALVRV